MSAKPQLPPVPKGGKIKHALSLGIDVWNNLDRYQAECGDSFTLMLPNQGPMVWTGDPDVVKDTFALSPDQYNPFEVQIPIDVGEQCVLFENFKKHQDSRKRIIPTLTTTQLKNRAGVMHEIITEYIDAWKVGEEFNFPRVVGDMTLDIICYTLFGLREGERKERYKKLILGWLTTSTNDTMFTIGSLMGARKFRAKLNATYQKRLNEGRMGNLKKGILPWKQPLDFKVQLAKMIIEDVNDIRSRMDESEVHLLSVFARAKYDDGNFLEMEKIISESIALMVAGHETSAATFAWMMVWMLKKPDVVKKIREEVAQSIAREGGFDPLKISELPYVTACLNESQRISPSAPATVRWLTRDTQLGKWLMPAGTCIAPCMYLTQRRKDVYGEDAHEFRPERWLDGSCKPKPWEFFPFGGGRRACAGMAQARQQIRIIIAEIARRVDFESKADYVHKNTLPTPRLVGGQTEPKDGVWVTVKAKRPASETLRSMLKSA
jgi:cytochrome P450